MESAISLCPYEPRQSSSLTTGTSTFIRTLARLPPSEVVPHPETVQVVPASYSSSSDGSLMLSITELPKSAIPSSSRRQMSFVMVHDSLDSNVSLVGVIFIKVMVSNTDTEPAGTLSITTVTSCHHHVLLYKRSSTHQRSTNTSTQQSNLVGELSSISFSSSNNPSTSSAQRGGESLLGELGGSGGNSHDSEEDCGSHDQ